MMINNNFIVKAVLVALVFSFNSFGVQAIAGTTPDAPPVYGCTIDGDLNNKNIMTLHGQKIKVKGAVNNTGRILAAVGKKVDASGNVTVLKESRINGADDMLKVFKNLGFLVAAQNATFVLGKITNGGTVVAEDQGTVSSGSIINGIDAVPASVGPNGGTMAVPANPGEIVVRGILNVENSATDSADGDLVNPFGATIYTAPSGTLNVKNDLTNNEGATVDVPGTLNVTHNLENSGQLFLGLSI